MKSKARFLPFAGALILLASLFMFSTASAQTVGTVKLSKSFITTPDGELKITVEDAAINTGVIQKDEEQGRSRRGVGTEPYVIPAGNYTRLQLVTFRTAKAPIQSASPRELYGISTLSATDTDIREDYQDVVVKLTGTYGADQAEVETAWNSLTSQTTIQDAGIPESARHPYSLENAAGGAFTLGITDRSQNVLVPVPITFSVTYKAPDLQDASVKLTSTTDNAGVQVKVPETGDDTAKFELTFKTATSPHTTHIVDLIPGVREDQINLNLNGSGCEPGSDGMCTGRTIGDDPPVTGDGDNRRYSRSVVNDADHITRSVVTTTTEVSIGIDLSGQGYQTREVNWIDVRKAPGATIPPGARLGWLMNSAPEGADPQRDLCVAERKDLRLSDGRYSPVTVREPGKVEIRKDAQGNDVRICWTGNEVRLAAAPGAFLTVTYQDGGGTTRTANANIETTKPTITVRSDQHDVSTRVRSARLIAEITDSDSGVDTGNNNVNIVFAPTASDLAFVGGSVAGPGVTVSAVTTVSIPQGVRAEASLLNVPPGETAIEWFVYARDNAGNVAVSDQNPTDGPEVLDDPATTANEREAEGANTVEPDPYKIRIDTVAPTLGTVLIDYDGSGDADPRTVTGAITGNYLDDENNIVEDATKGRNTSIRVIFNEDLNAGTVGPSDFRVNGVAPVSASTKGRNVFLTVPTFASDARPSVRVAGNISDIAGNIRPGGLSVESAQDGISPTITVTLNPASGYGQEQVTINIQSNETLLTAPVIRLSSKDQEDEDDGPMAGQPGLSAFTLAGSDLYRATFKPSVQPFRYNVNVDVLDTSSNPRSKGKAKADEDDSITIEIDKALPAQTSVTLPGLAPITSIDSKKTYKITRQNPFITIEWDSEAKEYGRITDKGEDADSTSDDTSTLTNDASDIAAAIKDDNKTFTSLDTHGGVDVTNLKIKIGEATYDVDTPMGDETGARTDFEDNDYVFNVSKSGKNRLLIAARNLQIGTYEMSFNGEDELGNTLKSDVKIKFEIKAPDPFKLELTPGWNLVSIPSLLVDTAIDTVIPADHPATTVFTYDPTQPGGWLSATRAELNDVAEGEPRVFDGSLKQITGSVAYWILTDSFEPLEIPFDPAAIRNQETIRQVPEVNLLQGWNLIPILDITGAKKFGADLNTPTAYLRGDVLRAYGYSPSTNRYTIVADDANLKIGSGYWVYMTKAKVLVP